MKFHRVGNTFFGEDFKWIATPAEPSEGRYVVVAEGYPKAIGFRATAEELSSALHEPVFDDGYEDDEYADEDGEEGPDWHTL